MTWRELPPLTTDVADQLPDFPELHLVAGHIDDYARHLWPEEHDAVARARPKRTREFSTGRYLARCAMADVGVPAAAVPRAEDRSPVWPEALLGSLTHAGDLAIAAVAADDSLRGVGIDLELAGRVTEPLFEKLFTPTERQRLARQQPSPKLDQPSPKLEQPSPKLEHPPPLWERSPDRDLLPTLMFSAKEAAYKAVYPQIGRFISFQDAEVSVDWPTRTLALRYVGDHPPNRLMNRGLGHFCVFGGYVLTVFLIPR